MKQILVVDDQKICAIRAQALVAYLLTKNRCCECVIWVYNINITLKSMVKQMDGVTLGNYILQRHAAHPITPMKLQKLLYYVKVWGLVAGTPIYTGDFYRWRYGPVDVAAYHHYKSYARQSIPAPTDAVAPELEQQALVDFIVDAYTPHSAYSLSAMTHREKPWYMTSENEIISEAVIRDYYSNHPFARNFNPFDPEHKPFYPVPSDTWYAFTMDMNPDDTEHSARVASFTTFKRQMETARATMFETLRR